MFASDSVVADERRAEIAEAIKVMEEIQAEDWSTTDEKEMQHG